MAFSEYVDKTGILLAKEVDTSKIYTNKQDALAGLNSVTITDGNESWKSDQLRYEYHDDGSVLVYNDGVPIGWTTIDDLNYDSSGDRVEVLRENGIAIGEDGLAVRIEEDDEIPNVTAETVDEDGETVGMSARYAAEDAELEKETIQVKPENDNVYKLDDGTNSPVKFESNMHKGGSVVPEGYPSIQRELSTMPFDASMKSVINTMEESNKSLGIEGKGIVELSDVYKDDYVDDQLFVRVVYENAEVYLDATTYQPHEAVLANGDRWFYNEDGTLVTNG